MRLALVRPHGEGYSFLRDVARLAGLPDRGRAVRDPQLNGTKSQTIAFRLCAGRTGALEWRPQLPAAPLLDPTAKRRTPWCGIMCSLSASLPGLWWLSVPQRARFGSKHPGPWLPILIFDWSQSAANTCARNGDRAPRAPASSSTDATTREDQLPRNARIGRLPDHSPLRRVQVRSLWTSSKSRCPK